MAKRIKVIISNESVNSYGFRVMTSGIDLSQYKRNPILLWMHNRPLRGTTDEVLPLGWVEDLEVKDGVLYGVPVIEATDEFSSNILKKWENGTLRMVSPRLEDPVFSTDKKHLVPGQLGATVISCKLYEVSIVDMGANDDALQLYAGGKALKLSSGINYHSDVPQIPKNKNMNELQQIALALALGADATLQAVQNQIAALLKTEQDHISLTKVYNDMINESITLAVQQAVDSKKIQAEQRDHFIALGKKIGLNDLNITLAAFDEGLAGVSAPGVRPSTVIGGTIKLQGAETYKSFRDIPADKVMALRADNPDEYKRLYKAEYGIDCKI